MASQKNEKKYQFLALIREYSFSDRIKEKLKKMDPTIAYELMEICISEDYVNQLVKVLEDETYRPKIFFLDDSLLHEQNPDRKIYIQNLIKTLNSRGSDQSGKIHFVSKIHCADIQLFEYHLPSPHFDKFIMNFHQRHSVHV